MPEEKLPVDAYIDRFKHSRKAEAVTKEQTQKQLEEVLMKMAENPNISVGWKLAVLGTTVLLATLARCFLIPKEKEIKLLQGEQNA